MKLKEIKDAIRGVDTTDPLFQCLSALIIGIIILIIITAIFTP